MPKSDFVVALTQLAAERGLPQESVLSAIEDAIASAYRRDSVASGQNITVKLDPGSGDVTVQVLKTVVDIVTDDKTEVALRDARKIAPDADIGAVIVTDSRSHEPGRIAAQTAKQVVMQRLRDAERDIVFKQYEDKAGEVFLVTLQKIDPRHIVVDLGRSEAIMPFIEQVPSERYRSNTKMRVLLKSVERSARGLELIVSRADKLLLRRLFEMEVPEIFSGAVEIEAIAREPGSRSKVAVSARQEGVDPVGSCVGLRGVRIQNIVNELHGEKIDVVEWSREAPLFIANALSPAQVLRVELNVDDSAAMAIVPERQLSLAIGREGQNARLAAHLTGWKVDIKSDVQYQMEQEARAQYAAEAHAAAVAAEAAAIAKARAASAGAFAFESEVDDAEQAAQPIAAELVQATDAPVSEPAAAEVAEIAQAAASPAAAELEPAVADADASNAEPVAESADSGKSEDEILEEMLAAEAAEQAAAELQRQEVEAQAPQPVAETPQPAPVATAPAAELAQAADAPAGEPAEQTTSLRDLPEDIWTVRRARARRPAPGDEDAPGRIRFAEDIAGLRGGVTASRRNRRRDSQPPGGDNRGPARRRKTNNNRRRR